MKLRLATENDSPALIEFYSETPVTTSLHLKLIKQGSFFFQYKMQSDDYLTYILVDESENNKIKAMVTLLFRQAIIEGEIQNVGYVTDLRISPERKVVLEWTHSLLNTLQKAKKERNCKYIFTVVFEGQQQALNAFIRPRNVRRELPRYYLYRKFEIVNLHGLWPWPSPPLSSVKTSNAQKTDLENLCLYIAQKNKGRTPNYNPSPEFVLKSIERWPGLDIEDFILAKDSLGKIVGCTAPWDSQIHEQFVPLKYDSISLTLKEVLLFSSYVSKTRRLSNLGEPMQFYYLSYLLADNTDIFYSLCRKAMDTIPKTHFLVYPHFEGSLMTQPAKSFISSRIRAGLYCVLDPEDAVPDFLKPRILADPPDFELAFI